MHFTHAFKTHVLHAYAFHVRIAAKHCMHATCIARTHALHCTHALQGRKLRKYFTHAFHARISRMHFTHAFHARNRTAKQYQFQLQNSYENACTTLKSK